MPAHHRAEIPCHNCGKRIYGGAETRYSDGWIHVGTNAERCNRLKDPTPDHLATPPPPPKDTD